MHVKDVMDVIDVMDVMDGSPATADRIEVDALIVGGGVAGLFLLNALIARGSQALLVESTALGTGQTTASQGILHAGMKYSLGGLVGDDAAEAAAAAQLWEELLRDPSDGGDPALSEAKTLTRSCHLWRSKGLVAAAALVGARLALTSRPELLASADRPSWLAGVTGDVLSLPERVVDPQSVLAAIANHHRRRVALGRVASITRKGGGCEVSFADPRAPRVTADHVYLCAGEGNESLAALAGVSTPMQRRPLHQAMLRGRLPMVFGHCIDGAKTRVTITSDRGRGEEEVIWHIGGQVAEDGVAMGDAAFRQHAAKELSDALGGFHLNDLEIATYRVNRAEPKTADGRRPPRGFESVDGAVSVVWPVKFVLAPKVAQTIAARSSRSTRAGVVWPDTMSPPPVAQRPWQQVSWTNIP